MSEVPLSMQGFSRDLALRMTLEAVGCRCTSIPRVQEPVQGYLTLIRKCTSQGPYRRLMPRVLGGS